MAPLTGLPLRLIWALGLVLVLFFKQDTILSFLGDWNTKNIDIAKDLGSQLSPNAEVLLPSHPSFAQVSLRWNPRFPLPYTAIVEAATEDDVSATILYANSNNIPFVAINGGHGAQLPMLKFKNGIGISLKKMKSLTLEAKTARIKGSWNSGEIMGELYKRGKRTVTGSCDCTGLYGPMLGGGHGILQGRYGLLADQVVEARVVLANGTAVTVSDESHKELYWALRGAGHNFGVVTEVKYRVYDVPKDDIWTHTTMFFPGTKLEEVAEELNGFTGHGEKLQPVELAFLVPWILRVPDIDPVNPVIMVHILYEGLSTANPILAPLQAVSPIITETKEITYPEASDALGFGWSGFGCMKGAMSILRFPVGSKNFNFPAMKEVYDHYAKVTEQKPEFNNTFVMWEAYSTQGVKAVPEEETAVSDRGDNMLVAPVVVYPPNSALDDEAAKFGEDLRRMIMKGNEKKELHAYINYANGDESLEEIYGHQTWRLEKLRRLKKEYDPYRRFSFYAPIV